MLSLLGVSARAQKCNYLHFRHSTRKFWVKKQKIRAQGGWRGGEVERVISVLFRCRCRCLTFRRPPDDRHGFLGLKISGPKCTYFTYVGPGRPTKTIRNAFRTPHFLCLSARNSGSAVYPALQKIPRITKSSHGEHSIHCKKKMRGECSPRLHTDVTFH